MKIRFRNLLKKLPVRKNPVGSSGMTGLFKVILLTLMATRGFGQDGNAGITAATTNITSYFATGVTLMYAIGAVLGLVGAVKVYQKWSHGDQDTSKVAASWFGSCIFLVIVATVLKSFFGV